MPRNPNKTRCQMPGCRNWAMRGHTHCRPHLVPSSELELGTTLGPRGAGAPPGNLNALRTGQHAQPISPDDLDQIVHDIVRAPDRLPHHLDLTIQSIHRRCQDPVKTLLALQALVPTLLSRVADDLFITELHVLRQQLPPTQQSRFEISVWRHALRLEPVHKLELIRRLQRAISAQDPTADQGALLSTPRPTPAHDRQEQIAPCRNGENTA
jgi:hypothetical protein